MSMTMTSSVDDPLRSKERIYGMDIQHTRQDILKSGRETREGAEGTSRRSNSKSNTNLNDLGPRSSYYTGPPGLGSVYGTPPVGVIGRDKPREIIRIERDYADGELCQFHPTFPLELEGRIRPVVFSETINDINVIIIQANSPLWACIDNTSAVLSLYTTPWILGTKYQREMKRLRSRIDRANESDFNPAGLNLLYPTKTAFLFLELEYY